MRKNIVAGNWKMHKTQKETVALVEEIIAKKTNTTTEIIVAPTFVNLSKAVEITNEKGITVAAQNMHQAEGGAFTGEIAASMLTDIGVTTVILGHSERRAYYGETYEILKDKVLLALENNLKPIFCIGEVKEEREANKQNEVVKAQLEGSVFNLSAEDFGKLVLAYEPVWAIGTGLTASPEQAQEIHAYIRSLVSDKYGKEVAENCSILYGGSCNGKNAAGLFANADIDGGLIGGAALKCEDFKAIIDAF